MKDPEAWCLLIGLFMVLALGAWALYAEMRIQILTSKLAISNMGAESAKAVAETHALDDSALDTQVAEDIGPGTKS